MIHEVDDALRALIRRDAVSGTDVEVAFDAPTKDWSSRRNAPTIDLYLYDIREDMRRREVGRVDTRDGDGQVTARLFPPRWFKLSYLLTAWTQRSEDEHRLLAACLGCFLRQDRLPLEVLSGSLADLQLPLPYTIALPPPEDRALSDVWSALGGELKPSLDLVVIAPFDLSREMEAGPPVLEEPRFSLTAGAVAEDVGRRGGVQRRGGAATPAASAEDAATENATPGPRKRSGKAAAGQGSDDEAAAAAAAAGQAEEASLTPPAAGSGAGISRRWLRDGAAEEWQGGTDTHPGRVFRLGELPRTEPPS